MSIKVFSILLKVKMPNMKIIIVIIRLKIILFSDISEVLKKNNLKDSTIEVIGLKIKYILYFSDTKLNG